MWSGPLVDSGGLGAPRRKKNAASDARESLKLPTGPQKDKSRDARFKGKRSIA